MLSQPISHCGGVESPQHPYRGTEAVENPENQSEDHRILDANGLQIVLQPLPAPQARRDSHEDGE